MAQHSADGSAEGNTAALPERYSQMGSSPLFAEVAADGENTFDFPLEP
jgi:hypothetical protein